MPFFDHPIQQSLNYQFPITNHQFFMKETR